MIGEEVFQLHVATPIYASQSMFIYKARQKKKERKKLNMIFFPCWCTTGSSFPAGVQKGNLSLLLINRASFPAGALQISTLKFCQGNQTK